jgi:hypothetical protein
MRRHLVSAVLAGLFGLLMMASDASACHCKKKACPPAPCAAPCPAPAPCPEPCAPAPCSRPRRQLKLFSCFKHKKSCAPTTACATPAPCNPCGSPVTASPQGHY